MNKNELHKLDDFEQLLKRSEQENEQEIPDGHLLRFKNRMATKGNKYRAIKLSFKRLAPIAAALVVGFFIASLFFYEDKHKEQVLFSDYLPELREAEVFYRTSMINGIEQVDHLYEEGLLAEHEKNLIEEEYKNFEEAYSKLLEQYQTHPDDKRVVYAMLRLYKTRLKLIERIINQLEQTHEEETRHEHQV